MKKLLALLLLVAVVAAFGGTLYFLWAKSRVPPVFYETKSAARATIVKKTVATGSVVPRNEVEVKPQIGGILDEVLVEPGAKVAKGDVIARIRVVPDMVTLNNAESRVNQARINLDSAARDLARGRELAQNGTISEKELQALEVAQATAEEELSVARGNLDLIREGRTKQSGSSNTLVRATLAGTVLAVPLEAGATVIESNSFNDGTTIATVADMEDMVFLGRVDESEVGKLRTGMNLELTVGALQDRKLKAVLEHVAPKGVELDGAIQFEIRAALEMQEDLMVRANYSANADIVLERREDVLALDEGLLVFDEGKTYVEVETAPQQFERRAVETGLSDGLQIEILSGVTEADRVKDPTSAASGKPGEKSGANALTGQGRGRRFRR